MIFPIIGFPCCIKQSIFNHIIRIFRQQCAQFLHRLRLNLANSLRRNTKFRRQLMQRQTAVILQPSRFHNTAAAFVQL